MTNPKTPWLDDLRDEFYQLRNDDEDFADHYDDNEFVYWLADQDLIDLT